MRIYKVLFLFFAVYFVQNSIVCIGFNYLYKLFFRFYPTAIQSVNRNADTLSDFIIIVLFFNLIYLLPLVILNLSVVYFFHLLDSKYKPRNLIQIYSLGSFSIIVGYLISIILYFLGLIPSLSNDDFNCNHEYICSLFKPYGIGIVLGFLLTNLIFLFFYIPIWKNYLQEWIKK